MILSVTTLSSFMVAVDANIVTIALPVLSTSLSSGIAQVGWVLTGYVVSTAAFLLSAGSLADRYGKKRIYLIGFALFGASSALCGISQSVLELVAFRILQGSAASILAATAYPLIYESFPPQKRGLALGINSVAWGVGSAAGPVLGGALVYIDWRFIFYINAPIALAAVLIGRSKIPSSFDVRTESQSRINPVSSVLLATTVSLVLLSLTFLDSLFAFGAAGTLALLTVNEVRSRHPMLNRELLKTRGFVYSLAALGILQAGFLGVPFLLSFYFQTVLGYSPLLAGAALAPLPFAIAISNPVGGRFSDRIRGSAVFTILGAATSSVGALLLSRGLLDGWGYPVIGATLAAVGLGQGFIWTPMLSAILKFSKPELRGVANGTAFTIVNIGFATSIAIAVAASAVALPPSVVSQVYFGSLSHLTAPQTSLLKEGMANALVQLGVVNLVALPFLYLVLREQRR
jgi:EmrB/QacA subfamily drug resistance transporter